MLASTGNSHLPLLCFATACSLCWLHSSLRRGSDSDPIGQGRLLDGFAGGFRETDGVKGNLHDPEDAEGVLADDIEGVPCEGKANGSQPKRRALLVGISYEHSPSNKSTGTWGVLEGVYADVERFRELLINTYEYSPKDIVVLMDDPGLSDVFQPTRVNMLHELRRLVAGAAPDDRFIFLYTGHTDQQDLDEDSEGYLDEVMITSDVHRIIYNELNDILVKGLPVDCSLIAILDTCHSGALLDLPHYHCNNLYVPWLSKGEHRTMATYHTTTVHSTLTLLDVMTNQWLNDAPSGSPLRIITEIDGISSANQYKSSVDANQREAQGSCSSPSPLLSPTRQYPSPVSVRCDGWCRYDLAPRPTVLSLSARADLQCTWEGPRGSLTAVLCRFLEKHPNPSYRTLMTHVNFQLYENCRALHEYAKTKAARGEGLGQLNFQSPQLSSLSKLKMSDIFRL